MLARPDPRVLSALARLEGNPDFEVIRGWMEGSLQDLDKATRTVRDDVNTRWLQGAAQAVDDFLTRCAEAKEILRKSR